MPFFVPSTDEESEVQRGEATQQSHPLSIHPAGPGPSSCPPLPRCSLVGALAMQDQNVALGGLGAVVR